MPDHVTARPEGHERELRNPRQAGPQPVNQRRFRRNVLPRPRERGSGNRANNLSIPRHLTPYQHEDTMRGAYGDSQLIYENMRDISDLLKGHEVSRIMGRTEERGRAVSGMMGGDSGGSAR